MAALKLKENVARHFFGSAVDGPSTQNHNPQPKIKTMKIKYHDAKSKKDYVATILDITEDEKLKVAIEHSGGVFETVTIDPKQISGLFVTTLGRELEVSFGVGKVSLSSLTDD